MNRTVILCACGRLIELLSYDDEDYEVLRTNETTLRPVIRKFRCPDCEREFRLVAKEDVDKYSIRSADEIPNQIKTTSKSQPLNIGQLQNKPKCPRIVLLDDEGWFREMCSLAISQRYPNAEIVKFEEGDAAWNELSQREPDLLMFDEGHPGMRGREMLRRLTERKASFPMIFMTVNDKDTMTEYEGLCAVIGPNAKFLRKPFTLEELYGVLKELLGPNTETNGIRVP